MNLILIGFTSTGKTVTARALAARLGLQTLDLDELIEQRFAEEQGESRTVRAIFQECGEQYFRELERETLVSLRQRDGMVLATGGGALLQEENRKLLQELGTVVFLDAAPETVFERMQNKGMPAFMAADPSLENLKRIMAERRPAYEATAHHRIDTDADRAEDSAEKIEALLR